MSDEEIDTSDIPPLGDSFFRQAKLTMPAGKEAVLINIDAEILEWIRSQEADFQSIVNDALRDYAETHR